MPNVESQNESETLRERVAELIALLHAREADDATGEALPDLRRLHDEIEGWIEAGDSSDRSWIDRLGEVIERIEIDHPQTTAVIGRISDSLSRLGI
jgi:hypothetical protein